MATDNQTKNYTAHLDRYLVFGGAIHHPGRGFQDFIASFSDYQAAVDRAKMFLEERGEDGGGGSGFFWAQVVDTHTMTIHHIDASNFNKHEKEEIKETK